MGVLKAALSCKITPANSDSPERLWGARGCFFSGKMAPGISGSSEPLTCVLKAFFPKEMLRNFWKP